MLSSFPVECRESRFGKGLFSTRVIQPGQIVAIFDGQIYEAESCLKLPNQDVADHAIQIGENIWQDSEVARSMNHSCNPNCGFLDTVRLRAMRVIAPGEELTFDYDTCEDSDWSMQCLCGAAGCRQVICGFKNLLDHYPGVVAKYLQERMIHPWLIQKYGILKTNESS